MNLRKKLIYLLAAYAAVVVGAAAVTIYGIKFHIHEAIISFDSSQDSASEIYRLRLVAREQILALREIIARKSDATSGYVASRDEFIRQLEHVGEVTPHLARNAAWRDVLRIADELTTECAACVTLINASRYHEAEFLLRERIEPELLDPLIAHLYEATASLADSSRDSVGTLISTNAEVLTLATIVGVLAFVLCFGGATLIRYWLIGPITKLREATEEYRRGHLGFRVSVTGDDELGSLGSAMNSMAESLDMTQAELHTSEAKYRALFENLRDAVIICDTDGCVVEYHQGDGGVLGGDSANIIGKHLLEAWPEWKSYNREWSSLIERVITTGNRFNLPDIVLHRNPNDDPAVIVDVIAYPVEYDGKRYVAIILRDVTEREELQRRVRHADKMEAAGTLAGGIAHDFNNLLTSAIGTLTLLGNEIEDEQQTDLAETALSACWQAAGLSRRLLNFAAGGYKRPQVLCLGEVVDRVVHSLDESVFEGIKVFTDDDREVLAKVDGDQLTQIILNLVRNASDAMPDGGELRVGVSATATAHPEGNAAPQQWAVLTVADTGGGMTAEVKKRLFEPFFSTKTRASHKGRGLGLAIVYAAVRHTGGFIRVDSQLGVGTKFRVHLPIGEGVPERIETPTYVAPAKPGHGTILVVDDEPMITQMCTTALEKWGYSVICADSIADAAQKFGDAGGDVALALIDINLPDGSGVLLAEDLVTVAPDLRIVFATGYAETQIPESLAKNTCARLAKPFALEDLVRTLSAALASEPPADGPESAGDTTPVSADP